jgi:hypothetical protein
MSLQKKTWVGETKPSASADGTDADNSNDDVGNNNADDDTDAAAF